jgi:two-component sensor histidine kinase
MKSRLFLIGVLGVFIANCAQDSNNTDRSSSKDALDSFKQKARLKIKQDSFQEAIDLFKQAIVVATENGDKGFCYNNLGYCYTKEQMLDSALYSYLEACRLFEGNAPRLAQAQLNLANILKTKGSFDLSSNYLYAALETIESRGILPREESIIHNTLGNIFKSTGDYPKALDHHHLAKKKRLEIADYKGLASSVNNIGNVYFAMQLYDSSIRCFQEYRTLSLKGGFKKKLGRAHANLAKTYLADGDRLMTKHHLETAARIYEDLNYQIGLLELNIHRSDYYRTTDLLQALKELQVANMKAKSLGLIQYEKETLDKLSQVYELLERPTKSLDCLKRSNRLNDSLFGQRNVAGIYAMESKYKSGLLNRQLIEEKKVSNQKSEVITSQRLVLGMLVVIFILMVVLIRVLWMSYSKQKQSKKRAQLLLGDLNHRVRHNLSRIHQMLHLQKRQTSNQKMKDLIIDNQSRIERMTTIHKRFFADGYKEQIDSSVFIPELLEDLLFTYDPEAKIKMNSHVEPIEFKPNTALDLGLLINELVVNSVKHAFGNIDDPEISLKLSNLHNGMVNLVVKDNGCGQNNGGNSSATQFGTKFIDSLVKNLKGQCSVDISAGRSTTITFLT